MRPRKVASMMNSVHQQNPKMNKAKRTINMRLNLEKINGKTGNSHNTKFKMDLTLQTNCRDCLTGLKSRVEQYFVCKKKNPSQPKTHSLTRKLRKRFKRHLETKSKQECLFSYQEQQML
jgi:hypothetical protein